MSSIKNIKHSSGSYLKKSLIQNMVSSKLHTLGNMRVMISPKEPKVNSYVKPKGRRPLTTSKDSINSRNSSKGKYSSNYIPKFRKSANTSKIKKDLSKIYKGLDKENMSRNNQIFSPILSINESEYSSKETVKKSPIRVLDKKAAGKKTNYGKFIKKPTPNKANLKNPDIQKIVKMNLDLIHAFSKGIEASRSIISSLASNDDTNKEELSIQLRTIENLSKEFNSSRYTNEISGMLKSIERKKFVR